MVVMNSITYLIRAGCDEVPRTKYCIAALATYSVNALATSVSSSTTSRHCI